MTTPKHVSGTIRQLIWEHHPAGFIAGAGLGAAFIIDTRVKGRFTISKGLVFPKDFDTLEAAKSAAQADYAARILAAIQPEPEPQPVACRNCGGQMKPGVALSQTLVAGLPDDLGGDISTMSAGGPGALIDCCKCADCGWSVTMPEPVEVRPADVLVDALGNIAVMGFSDDETVAARIGSEAVKMARKARADYYATPTDPEPQPVACKTCCGWGFLEHALQPCRDCNPSSAGTESDEALKGLIEAATEYLKWIEYDFPSGIRSTEIEARDKLRAALRALAGERG